MATKRVKGLRRAVRLAEGVPNLARKLNVHTNTIRVWLQQSTYGKPPEARCEAIEKATGVPKEELRPDIF